MPRVMAVLVVVLSFLQLAPAQNKERITAFITKATWIYITTDAGDEFSARISPEDRQAIKDLRGALRDWGRYKLANRIENADLIFVIHSGGNGGLLGSVNRTITRGDFGSDDDTLFVYLAQQFPQGTHQWDAAMKNGFALPRMPLFEKFKQQVEEVASSRKP